MLHEKQIGRAGKPETCAISGKPLASEDVYFAVGDVLLGVKAMVFRAYTPEQFADLRKGWAKDVANAAPVSKAKSAPEAGKPVGE